MFCRKCGESIPDASAFCNKCGVSQSDDVPKAAPSVAPSLGAISHDPVEPERELWKGRFSAKALAHLWILWGLWLIALSYLFFFALAEGREGKSWITYVYLGLIGLPALYILFKLASYKLTVRYRLTTDRFFKEVGFISRTINEIELIRVDDVSVSQNLIQRIFNVGKVMLISTDSTDPRTEIFGIHNPIEVKEVIRTHVRKRRDRALHMESL